MEWDHFRRIVPDVLIAVINPGVDHVIEVNQWMPNGIRTNSEPERPIDSPNDDW